MRGSGEGFTDSNKRSSKRSSVMAWISGDEVLVICRVTNDHMIWTPTSERSDVQLVACAVSFLFGYCGTVWGRATNTELKRGRKPLLSEERSVLITLQYA